MKKKKRLDNFSHHTRTHFNDKDDDDDDDDGNDDDDHAYYNALGKYFHVKGQHCKRGRKRKRRRRSSR